MLLFGAETNKKLQFQQVVQKLALTAGELTSLATSVPANVFLPVCTNLSALRQLDLKDNKLSDGDVFVLSSNLPHLVELKFTQHPGSSSIDTLYHLRQLSLLQVLELESSGSMLLDYIVFSSMLHVLPQLKIAGAKICTLLPVGKEQLNVHIVPLGQQPLALEHLILSTGVNFSHGQAQMLPNVTALFVSCVLTMSFAFKS